MRGKAAPWMRFNEAAGFTQRKLTNREATYTAEFEASMRPPVLPSGNTRIRLPPETHRRLLQ